MSDNDGDETIRRLRARRRALAAYNRWARRRVRRLTWGNALSRAGLWLGRRGWHRAALVLRAAALRVYPADTRAKLRRAEAAWRAARGGRDVTRPGPGAAPPDRTADGGGLAGSCPGRAPRNTGGRPA